MWWTLSRSAVNDEKRLEAEILGKQLAHNEEMIVRWEREEKAVQGMLERLRERKEELKEKQKLLLEGR